MDSFHDLLEDLDPNGSLDEQLMERAERVTEGVRKTGRQGTVTLKIKFKSAGAGKVEVEPSIKSSEPKTVHPQRLYFTDDKGRLHRKDPRQHEMDLRDADRPRPLRSANAAGE